MFNNKIQKKIEELENKIKILETCKNIQDNINLTSTDIENKLEIKVNMLIDNSIRQNDKIKELEKNIEYIAKTLEIAHKLMLKQRKEINILKEYTNHFNKYFKEVKNGKRSSRRISKSSNHNN